MPEKICSFELTLESTIKFFLIVVDSYFANGAGGQRYGGYKCKPVTVKALETFGES
jgi:hypothetical protein